MRRVPTLTVTKTAHLFSTQKVLRPIAERDVEKAEDEKESDEARRRVTIEHLAESFRIFLDDEPKKNPKFAR
jgi:hypothetical protein